MNKQKTLSVMAWLTVLLSITCLSLFIYSKYIEQPFLYYQNRPFPAVFKTIIQGSVAPYEVERCSTSDKKEIYKITRRLIHLPKEGQVKLPDILFEAIPVDIDPGCHREISKVMTAPLSVPVGVWMASGIALVPGLFREHKIPWYSEPFEIVKKPEVKP
jgi:hypothetical protein